MLAPAITNALTIDVEDYFQVSAFAPYIRRGDWDARECRVERNVDRILAAAGRARHAGHLLHARLGGRALPGSWCAASSPAATSWPATATATSAPATSTERPSATTSTAPRSCSRTSAACRCAATARRASRSARTTCGPSTRWPEPATATAPASTRSGTTTTACPTRRASRTGATTACSRSRSPRCAWASATCRPAAAATSGCCPTRVSRWMLRRVNRDGPAGRGLLLPPLGDRRRRSRASPASTPRRAFATT